jgi:ornithine decarboxylase
MLDFKHAEELVADHGTPILFLSGNRIRENYRSLQSALSQVGIYYAVKSNPLPQIVSILAQQGANFDLATSGEIKIMQSCGVGPERCIHTHPIKNDAEIRAALDFGIEIFVVDNEHEVDKLLPYRDRAKVLVRMSIQNPACLVNLSHKFGVKPTETFSLIKQTHEKGLAVKGISFHVGSQSENALKYLEALEYCRDICRKSALTGIALDIIDIGGGFPIPYINNAMPIAQFCASISEYLDRYFAGYRVIAEPGRFISGTALTLAARIVGKSYRDGVWWYYLDDGVYGSFSGKIFDHSDYPFTVPRSGKTYLSTIAGPTCDSIDVLYENTLLPQMEIGDILLFGSMGAYTNASATWFNGIPPAKIVVLD